MISKRHCAKVAFAFGALALSEMLIGGAYSGAFAQGRVEIRFAPGATSTTINGAIRGSEYIDYVVSARGGQTMVVSLAVTGTNGNGSAYFNILPAGQDHGGPYTGSTDDDRRAEITVPSDGYWVIRVYLMGNDRDTGKTVGYSIDVYVAPSSTSGGASSSRPGLLPEEDFFVVRLSNAGGYLNVRNAPRASAQTVGRFPDGVVLRNAGGCTMSDGRQWCDVEPPQGGVRGWVSARFLALPEPGSGGSSSAPSNPDVENDVVQVTGVPTNDILNVRSGPGTGNRVVGALGNGDSVRRIGCQSVGSATWCEIEMMTDMRERGWVNARYLARQGEQATQLPSASRMERVHFAAGSSGTEFTDQLGPGTSVTYIVGARNGQELYLRLAANGPNMTWRLYNPDGSLLDEASSGRGYRGQLWQSGDHKIEVTNQGNGTQSFNVIIGIQ